MKTEKRKKRKEKGTEKGTGYFLMGVIPAKAGIQKTSSYGLHPPT